MSSLNPIEEHRKLLAQRLNAFEKGIVFSAISDGVIGDIEKSMRDTSHLTLVEYMDKNGKKGKHWVHTKEPDKRDIPMDSKVVFEHKGHLREGIVRRVANNGQYGIEHKGEMIHKHPHQIKIKTEGDEKKVAANALPAGMTIIDKGDPIEDILKKKPYLQTFSNHAISYEVKGDKTLFYSSNNSNGPLNATLNTDSDLSDMKKIVDSKKKETVEPYKVGDKVKYKSKKDMIKYLGKTYGEDYAEGMNGKTGTIKNVTKDKNGEDHLYEVDADNIDKSKFGSDNDVPHQVLDKQEKVGKQKNPKYYFHTPEDRKKLINKIVSHEDAKREDLDDKKYLDSSFNDKDLEQFHKEMYGKDFKKEDKKIEED